jgi:hypothetical protein
MLWSHPIHRLKLKSAHVSGNFQRREKTKEEKRGLHFDFNDTTIGAKRAIEDLVHLRCSLLHYFHFATLSLSHLF